MASVVEPLWPIQQGIVTALGASADFTATGASGPYDATAVPDGTPYPYVTFGTPTTQPASTFGRRGWDTTIQLDIWSQYTGRAEAYAILAALNAALERKPLPAPGLDVYFLQCEFSTVLDEPDGLTRHAVARYRVQVQAQ